MRGLLHKLVGLLAWTLLPFAQAKVDLVTVPQRDTVQVTIYNSADLTLVREQRALTLREGPNRLQFSWSNTLIDPTSLEMLPLVNGDKINVSALVFPPRVKDLGLWTVDSEVSGENAMEISYLTSGLSWRAFYMATLKPDESAMRLQGYVRVTNNSGEDYENAQTRLIVGKVNLIDQIADLAKREAAYGRPTVKAFISGVARGRALRELTTVSAGARMEHISRDFGAKEIKQEGLSEYYLYTIEGTETIPHGWSKRLPSFNVAEVPVLNLYKYDEAMYANQTVRFLNFKNDAAHQLGETPIPGGAIKVYRQAAADQHLSYEGQSQAKYIPVDEEVELNLGAVGNVMVTPTLMDFKTAEHLFDGRGNVNGWDEQRRWKLALNNTREVKVKIQIDRHFPTAHWSLKSKGADHKKIDLDTVRYTVELAPFTRKEIEYELITYHGERENK